MKKKKNETAAATETSDKAEPEKKFLLSDWIVKILPFTKWFFEKLPWLSQFVNFSAVGVINFVLSSLIYSLIIYFAGESGYSRESGFAWDIWVQAATQISYWISVLNGYLLNRFWVFAPKKKGTVKNKGQTVRYFVVYGFNYLLGIILPIVYLRLGINEYLFPYISFPITIPLNYCLNRFWVFRERGQK